MYTSAYEMEKLAELRRDELVRNAERIILSQNGKKRARRTLQGVAPSSWTITEPPVTRDHNSVLL